MSQPQIAQNLERRCPRCGQMKPILGPHECHNEVAHLLERLKGQHFRGYTPDERLPSYFLREGCVLHVSCFRCPEDDCVQNYADSTWADATTSAAKA